MFKEFILGVFILCILYIILRLYIKNNNNRLPFLPVCMVFGLLALISFIYNGLNVFPSLYLDTSTGVYRYGKLSGNLFAYSDEFRYRDQILFPILKERTVYLDQNSGFYNKFFSLFSREAVSDQLNIQESVRERVLTDQAAFDYVTDFNSIALMDYATDSIPLELEAAFDDKQYPKLYINLSSIKGSEALVVMTQPDYSVYIMGEAYYKALG